jgi:uncharacterized protein (TIGR03086 family)
MTVLNDYDRAAAAASAIIGNITPAQFTDPTPCDKWTVRDVINHMTFGNLMAVAMLADDEPPDRAADHLGSDPSAAFSRSVSAARAALSAPGALSKVVRTPLGEQPGAFVVHMRINELIVHSWDLARATGQPTDIEPDLAEAALAQWRARLTTRPPDGPFAPEQPAPPNATAADRLAAFLGR